MGNPSPVSRYTSGTTPKPIRTRPNADVSTNPVPARLHAGPAGAVQHRPRGADGVQLSTRTYVLPDPMHQLRTLC